MGYGRFLAVRTMNAIITLIIVVFIISILFNTVAEDQLKAQIEEQVKMLLQNPEVTSRLAKNETALKEFIETQRAMLYKQYGLDRPFMERVMSRTVRVLLLDFGKASVMRALSGVKDVSVIILEALPNTVLLFTTAQIIIILIGIGLGVKAAQKSGTVMDRSLSVFAMVSTSFPMWWVGMLMILFFAYGVSLFPSGGIVSLPPPKEPLAYALDVLWHMALPVSTVVLVSFGGWAYVTRNIMIGVLTEDFIMVARAKGVPERKVIYGHALRAAAPPIVTMTILSLIGSLGGAIITESVFNWPGMGRLYWIAISEYDVPVLMGLTFIFTFLFLFAMVLTDITYGLLDPRVRVGERRGG